MWVAADSSAAGSVSTWLASIGPVMAAKAKISNQLPVSLIAGGRATPSRVRIVRSRVAIDAVGVPANSEHT
ncbi:MAG: hypothetical protein ACRDNF_17555, partial [Streptosporangiaceae bacterium]